MIAAAPTPEVVEMRERIQRLERRLDSIETASTADTLGTSEVMSMLGYKSGKRFWEAVRRLGLPYSRVSGRVCVFRKGDVEALLRQRQIGSGRNLRRSA